MFKVQSNQLSFDQNWLCQSRQDYSPYRVYCDHGGDPHDRRRKDDCSLSSKPDIGSVSCIYIEEVSNPSEGSQNSSLKELQIEKQEEEEEGVQEEKEKDKKENSLTNTLLKEELNKRWEGVFKFDSNQDFVIKVIDFKR